MSVKVSFDYEPDDPDEDSTTGMSEEEYDKLTEDLMALGAENIEVRQS